MTAEPRRPESTDPGAGAEEREPDGAPFGAKPNTPEARLRRRISDFIRVWVDPFRRIAPEALRIWEGKPGSYHGPYDTSEPARLLFNDFFVYDYVIPGSGKNATVLELYRAQHGMRLPHDERFLLENWIASYLSVYEVARVQTEPPGEEGIAIVDLFTRASLVVHDVAASKGMVRYDVFLGRVTSTGDRFGLSGAAYFVPRELLGEFLGRVERACDVYRENRADATLPEFLKAQSATVRSLLREVIEGLQSPVLAGGDRVAPSEANYDLLDTPAASSALASAEDFKEVEGGPKGIRRFHWIEVGLSAGVTASLKEGSSPKPEAVLKTVWVSPDGTERRIILGEIRFGHGRLLATALSWERLQKLRTLLEGRLGSKIRYRRSSTREARPAPAPRAVLPRLPQGALGDPAGDPARAAFDAEADRWNAEPQPALSGKSPSQAAADPATLPILLEILKDIENKELRSQKDRKEAPLAQVIRARLRLPAD